MIVCQCNVISDRQIRAAVAGMISAEGPSAVTPGAVIRALGARRQCSGCARTLVAVIDDCRGGCGHLECQGNWALED